MKKWLVLFVVVLLMSMGIGNLALADASYATDEYELNPAGWPDRHWVYMSDDEITQYENAGWERYVGVLWYDDEAQAIDFAEVQTEAIQDLYNKGYSFHVIYHWLCDGEKLGKHQEQSVYVGRWKLSPQQAIEYHNTYVIPNQVNAGNLEKSYYSMWYFKSQESGEPKDSDPVEILQYYRYVRHIYDTYRLGYGSELYLRNGEYDSYSLDEAVSIGGFDNEIVHWN